MAKCKKCGKDVGCGCNLTNGLCKECIKVTPSQVAPVEDFILQSMEDEIKLMTRYERSV